ncbi:MAG: GNAT family N-acetyltransferase, partial [Chloroflexi bacterium]|nr:GNAT family N-acetyltransferase [Chloroflexota bacterium]
MGDGALVGIAGRFADGKRCYVAQAEDEIAAYGWVSFREEQIGEIGLRVRLAAGEAYIWDCATPPAYRRRRLYAALLSHIVGELRAEGLGRLWIGADAANLPSQGGLALAGFVPVADLLITPRGSASTLRLRARPDVPPPLAADAQSLLLTGP